MRPAEVVAHLASIDEALEARETAVCGTHDATGFHEYADPWDGPTSDSPNVVRMGGDTCHRIVPPSAVRSAADVALGAIPGLALSDRITFGDVEEPRNVASERALERRLFGGQR